MACEEKTDALRSRLLPHRLLLILVFRRLHPRPPKTLTLEVAQQRSCEPRRTAPMLRHRQPRRRRPSHATSSRNSTLATPVQAATHRSPVQSAPCRLALPHIAPPSPFPISKSTLERETPPPPPPQLPHLDPLGDLVIPAKLESPPPVLPSYVEVVRRGQQGPRPSPVPQPLQPRQLRSTINVPPWSSYYSANPSPRPSPNVNSRSYGRLHSAASPRNTRSLRRAQPIHTGHQKISPYAESEPGWTRVMACKRGRHPEMNLASRGQHLSRGHSWRHPTAAVPRTNSTSAARLAFLKQTQGRCFKCLS
ncbi:hypothetical protein SEVIR_2G255850v4 [Setaria viridis]|uniref:Uncharacterized protein n=1 Tax=Setaria viridis TaxID=4556 RepID=A0A4V6DBD6_SETVI|nr:hypothetical protein SEVIR_2G255850v2 [Setaria viridis]